MEQSVLKNYVKYVSLNILGMIGLSCYILADTFFVSKALGAAGLAALNFSISIYSLIHGTGLMIGIGGATRYSILKYQREEEQKNIAFTSSLKLGILAGAVFAAIGILWTVPLAVLLGADEVTLPLTRDYLRTILCFAPFFILNNIVLAFVRNDNNPRLSMIAMLTGSFSNIILDYVFMFPLGMGMFGAAFATGLAPVISLGILSFHFIFGKCNLHWMRVRSRLRMIRDILSLGLAAFITEVSSAIVLITFNWIILKLEGNVGVASYGIVANLALVGISVFTGIAQGIQPLVSKAYGLREKPVIRKLLRYAVVSSLVIASAIYLLVYFGSGWLTGIFNSGQNASIALLAEPGLKIYFIGFFFAGVNIIVCMYLSAAENAMKAFLISVARGCVILVPMAFLLSAVWGMTGVWMAFVATEGLVSILAVLMIFVKKTS
ncbi:putative MATE family efflux protein [Anaerotaenia torta]|uniref:MATE family efflux transporter n=1 Tax=Anaerotaenia torta TaxID=433293 RepID=UPI003D232CF9